MTATSIKSKLEAQEIFYYEDHIMGKPSVIGYEKKFKWAWMATQMNLFIVATEVGDEEITVEMIEKHLTEGYAFSKQHYTGWPKGFQSGVGVISILISSNVSAAAKAYCTEMKAGKKWAGFSIPVVYDSSTNETFQFEKNPMWGRIYYPHFRKMIDGLK